MQTNYDINEVHKSQIVAGDTILHNGQLCTVSKSDIKICSFMGRTIFGDSYRSGYMNVKKVIFTTAKAV